MGTALLWTLAAAGGGSSGFGGGGGGGGGFGGGGFGAGGAGSGSGGGGIGVLVIVVIVLGFLAVSGVTAWRVRRRRAARVREVARVSNEAAEDDAAFAAAQVTADAQALFRSVQDAWDARDADGLQALVGSDLMVEWRRRLDDFAAKGWHNRVSIQSGPHIEYMGLTNREDDRDDRVVVRITARLRDVVQTRDGRTITHKGDDATTRLAEWWTLARGGGRWIVVAIEQDAEGAHHLDEPLVPSLWSDTGRLRDEALLEGAAADKALPGFSASDLADLDFRGTARQQAMDLALADGCFSPDVLEVAVRRAVAAWAEAIDGSDAALLSIATPQAAQQLLRPDGDATRVVIRGGRIESVAVERLDGAADPARMTIAVALRGRRYVEDRDTAAVLSGRKGADTSWTERWVLGLSGEDTEPWRVLGRAGDVAAGTR